MFLSKIWESQLYLLKVDLWNALKTENMSIKDIHLTSPSLLEAVFQIKIIAAILLFFTDKENSTVHMHHMFINYYPLIGT